MKTLPCPICEMPAVIIGSAMVRCKYEAIFFQCNSCGYAFVPNPTWLGEAYEEPINRSDVGYVSRNISLASRISCLLRILRMQDQPMLDFGAGYGLFTRLMRDRGFHFYWNDKYCPNLFASGFEEGTAQFGRFTVVTSFEVMEHVPDPRSLLTELAAKAENIILSTVLIPYPAPPLNSWWYYGLDHGQHISFLSRKALCILAGELGLKCQSDGDSLHFVGRKPPSHAALRASRVRVVQMALAKIAPRASLQSKDFASSKLKTQ